MFSDITIDIHRFPICPANISTQVELLNSHDISTT